MLHIRQSAPAAQGGGNLIFSFGEVDGRLTGHGFVCERVMVRTASVIHSGAAACGELRARASKSIVRKTNCFSTLSIRGHAPLLHHGSLYKHFAYVNIDWPENTEKIIINNNARAASWSLQIN